jgi:hypothetical protein
VKVPFTGKIPLDFLLGRANMNIEEMIFDNGSGVPVTTNVGNLSTGLGFAPTIKVW